MEQDTTDVLRAAAARMAQARAEFEAVNAEVRTEIATVAEEFAPLTGEQEEELAEHYRSGEAGPVLRDLQARVDRGDTTWDAIKSGHAEPPELTEKYVESQTKLGRALKAASEGRDMKEFLDEEHRQGHYYTPGARTASRGKPASAEEEAPNARPADDDLSAKDSWMEQRRQW